jgi:AcrR family transcriptional regulator
VRVKLSLDKVESLCREHGTSVAHMLREAGVSRNAFYTLARKETVVPQSLVRVAGYLSVPVSELLDDVPPAVERAKRLMAEVNRIVKRHPGVDPDNIRHTLLLLDEEPIERLRRALQRGRPVNIR